MSKLGQFLKNERIIIPGEVKDWCAKGIEITTESKDPLHDNKHVESILDNLSELLREEKEIDRDKIDFSVLLLAICWHDVWKSKRFPSNIFKLIYHYFGEGWGSRGIFLKAVKDVELLENIAREVGYAIRKHPGQQFLKHKSIESKLLWDLDTLEGWNIKRLTDLLDNDYLVKAIMSNNKKLLKIGMFYYKRVMKRERKKKLYFEWSKEEFRQRRENFDRETAVLMEKYEVVI